MANKGKQDFNKWTEGLKTGGRDRIYKGEKLRSVAMPLGGIGTGYVALAGDGGLRQWQIWNIPNHAAYLPNAFFSVRTEAQHGAVTAKVLQSSALYDTPFEPVPSVSDYVVPDGARKLLAELPGVAEIEYIGEYPVAEVAYKDPELPIEVKLEAFSPFIPLNSKDSGIPAVIFNFKIKNLSSDTSYQVSIGGVCQNGVGYDGVSDINGVECARFGGNLNEFVRLSGFSALHMTNSRLPEDYPSNGSMSLAVLSRDVTYLASFDDSKLFWSDFTRDGKLDNIRMYTPTGQGKTSAGALATGVGLGPGEEKTITYLLTWCFPNRYINWQQWISDQKSRFWIGNMYNNWFTNSLEVVEYVVENFERLQTETKLFRDTFYHNTLPYWFLDCVSSQISTIRSPTCVWNEDGTFHAFEGCHGASTGPKTGGCCPLNCTHVWNYEMTLSRLFPDLERSMRNTDLNVQMHEKGGVPARTALPQYLGRYHDDNLASSVFAVDGHLGTILKTYREFLQSGDKEWLDSMWPKVKKGITYAIERWDSDRDGVIDGPQGNTYDCDLYGHNSFITGMYLAALRAGEEMAKLEGDTDFAWNCNTLYKKGRVNIDSETFNGEYYIQVYDAEEHKETQYGAGCHSDQLLGQWWAHSLGLGYILPKEHVRSALSAIYKYNFRHNFLDHTQAPRAFASLNDMGLLCCTWPNGGRPEKPIHYSDEVWTGIEYEVAGLMLYEGMVEEAFQVIKAARDRYDGIERNPWNEIECGDHYARPMSSWLLLESAAGYHYNAAEASMTLNPRFDRNSFNCFFITGSGWGNIDQQVADEKQIISIQTVWGNVNLTKFISRGEYSKVKTVVGDRAVEASVHQDGGMAVVSFAENVSIEAGKSLVIIFTQE